jgi:outer membrane protein with beta-barrel domain
MKLPLCVLLTVVTFVPVAVAQSKKDKIEIGVHSTSLTLFHPDFTGDETQAGFGGRVTYNFNRSIAAEAEINFFPEKQQILTADGNAVQAQFGVKLGKRFDKFGLFAKVRPGFLSVDRVFIIGPDSITQVNGVFNFDFKLERRTFFTLDAGGVLELYPSKRTVVRFEAGDTAIRHPERFVQLFAIPPMVQRTRGPKFNHNFQFTAGVGFRLGDWPSEDNGGGTSVDAQDQTPRYEVGAQFTSLSVNPPSRNCFGCASLIGQRTHTEPGFGGRFTFNLTDNVAVEAEGNYFTRKQFSFLTQSGHLFQGQFGAKVGKRFWSWGFFGKARPGFAGFSRVTELVGSHLQDFGTISFEVPDFRVVTKYYPSLDIGGVVEFYVSRRWMARFDVGDTVIRYGEFRQFAFGAIAPAIITEPAKTKHNLQVTTGLGFRF